MNKKITTSLFAFVLLASVLSISSCKKADIKFGEEFLDNDITQIYKTDSFGVNLSTVFLDSFITSARGSVLIGAYTDPFFGRVTTQSYFDLIPPIYADAYANTSFDSLSLILKPNFNFYGDSTVPVNITVDELQDSIYLQENSFVFYNTSKFNVKPSPANPLANKNVIIRPQTGNEINIKLPNTLGNTLLNKLKDPTDNTLKNSAAFLSYFKGMRLSTDINSQMIVNCSDAVIMRLYYKKTDLITAEKYVDFTLANKAHQFNNISIARTVGDIKTLGPTKREIPSSLSGNAAYTQAATGSMIKMTFPSLKDLQKLPNFAKVLKATLTIKPVKGTYTTTYFLPPTLRLSTTNSNNKVGDDLAYITNNGALAIQLGLLQTDYFVNENTQYQYDLTEYVKNVLRTTTITSGEGLLLTPPSPNFESQLARVIIGNKDNMLGKIQLQIYYAAVK